MNEGSAVRAVGCFEMLEGASVDVLAVPLEVVAVLFVEPVEAPVLAEDLEPVEELVDFSLEAPMDEPVDGVLLELVVDLLLEVEPVLLVEFVEFVLVELVVVVLVLVELGVVDVDDVEDVVDAAVMVKVPVLKVTL